MVLIKPSLHPDDMTMLAPMECVSSCVVTYLKMIGWNEHLFLANYWNLHYINQNLLSSKSIHRYNVEKLYDLHAEYVQSGSREHLRELLQQGGVAFFGCRASGFRYFPDRLLTHDNSGFFHCVIIYGFHAAENTFLIADPIARYTGEISYGELAAAAYEKDQMKYYTLQPREEDASQYLPQTNDLFRFSVTENLLLYTEGESIDGVNAYSLFQHDLQQSFDWESPERDNWIALNNITFTAISKMRPLVWKSMLALNVLTEKQTEEGARQLVAISRSWATLNFLLFKYKRNAADRTQLEAIEEKLGWVKQAELQFLAFMVEVGEGLP